MKCTNKSHLQNMIEMIVQQKLRENIKVHSSHHFSSAFISSFLSYLVFNSIDSTPCFDYLASYSVSNAENPCAQRLRVLKSYGEFYFFLASD
jgi:hypothetical protein